MFYMLRHIPTGDMVGVSYTATSSDGDFQGDTVCELFVGSDALWVTARREVAEKAATTDTAWYNSDHDNPCNRYVGQLEVVEVKTVV